MSRHLSTTAFFSMAGLSILALFPALLSAQPLSFGTITEPKPLMRPRPLVEAAGPEGRGNVAGTPREKKLLLDRAADALIWFQTFDTENKKRTLKSNECRRHLAPIELIQAALLLKQAKQDETAVGLLEIFPYMEPSPMECFEIEERFNEQGLHELYPGEGSDEGAAGNVPAAIRLLRNQSKQFMEFSLNAAERLALHEQPATAAELIRAAALLLGTGRPQLIRSLLGRFNACEPAPNPLECDAIINDVGESALMALALDPLYAPHAQAAVARIMETARQRWGEPDAIQIALRRIASGEAMKAGTAGDDLMVVWRGAELSIPHLIDRFDTATDSEANEIAAVLRSMRSEAKEALAESLKNKSPRIVRHAVRALATMVGPQESPLFFTAFFNATLSEGLREEIRAILENLLGAVPGARDAGRILYDWSLDYHERRRPIRDDADGMVDFWSYESEQGTVVRHRLPAQAAYRHYACRYAEAAHALLPDSETVTLLYLSSLLERTASLEEFRAPGGRESAALKHFAAELDIDLSLIEKVLEQNLRTSPEGTTHFGAARIAALLLGELGTAALCEPLPGKDRSRAIVRAVDAPDRQVRFAALEAIMKWKPMKPYPGAARVAEALLWFARSEGIDRVVTAAPKQSDAMALAGHLIPLGYAGETATTGGDAMRRAAETPDVLLMLIDVRCRRPEVETLVQSMRSDSRTHDIPIAVLSGSTGRPMRFDAAAVAVPIDLQTAAERKSPENPFAHSIALNYPTPQNPADARRLCEDLFWKTAVRPPAPDVRLVQGRKSLLWIRDLLLQSLEPDAPKLYVFEEPGSTAARAMNSPTLFFQGVELAAAVKSAAMQQMLTEWVGRENLDIETRKLIASRFAESVERFGVLLRGQQVQSLYDRYNASETESKESQEVLSSLLDAVENKTFP